MHACRPKRAMPCADTTSTQRAAWPWAVDAPSLVAGRTEANSQVHSAQVSERAGSSRLDDTTACCCCLPRRPSPAARGPPPLATVPPTHPPGPAARTSSPVVSARARKRSRRNAGRDRSVACANTALGSLSASASSGLSPPRPPFLPPPAQARPATGTLGSAQTGSPLEVRRPFFAAVGRSRPGRAAALGSARGEGGRSGGRLGRWQQGSHRRATTAQPTAGCSAVSAPSVDDRPRRLRGSGWGCSDGALLGRGWRRTRSPLPLPARLPSTRADLVLLASPLALARGRPQAVQPARSPSPTIF